MSLASACQDSMRGDDNSYRTSPWFHGNLPVVPEQCTSGEILNLQWRNTFRSCSTDLSPKQEGNFAIFHTSTTGERIGGTPKMIDQRSPISPLSPQGTGSDGLPQTSQSQRFYCSERNQMSDDLIQNSSHNDGSFNDQRYIHESFPYNTEHSHESSICIQSSSGGSPMSSQHSQSYSCDSRYFQSPEDAADPVGNGYSGNEQPAALKILEQIETALLGPDGDFPADMDYVYGESNSEWSLEAWSGFNDILDQTCNLGYPQTNNSRAPDNLQQLPNRNPGYPQTNNSRAPDNSQQLPNRNPGYPQTNNSRAPDNLQQPPNRNPGYPQTNKADSSRVPDNLQQLPNHNPGYPQTNKADSSRSPDNLQQLPNHNPGYPQTNKANSSRSPDNLQQLPNHNPGYPQTNKANSSRSPDNLQQLPSHGDRNVKVETVNEVNFKTEHCSPSNSHEEQHDMEDLKISQGDVKSLLIQCAKAIADNLDADNLITALKEVVNIHGDPIHRLAAYMVEGLVARKHLSGGHIYKILKCKQPTSSELLSYMHILYEVCPYFKFGYVAANGAIAEAFKDKDRVHIIDFQIAQGSQWITLIQAFAARQGGSPHVRITGVDDPDSEYARGQGLNLVGERLSKLAESCQVPFEFHALPVFGSDVYAEMLDIRPGEALAVNFPLQLHHMPDESVSTSNHRDRLLRMVKGLGPDVVTLVEQEANTNTAPFFPRFMETLSYYTAMFESLDVTLPRDSKERVNVEQHCLARDIVNVIACEGAERVERHELFGKWRSRLTMAGFKSYPLSSHVNSTIGVVLSSYNQNYRLVEKHEALYLGWLDRDLIVASAWK